MGSFRGIAMARVDANCENGDGFGCRFRPFAFDCSLTPCVKQYNGSVVNGVYREEQVDELRLNWVKQQRRYEVGLNYTVINGTVHHYKPASTCTERLCAEIALPGSVY